jgi:hypothetical protein
MENTVSIQIQQKDGSWVTINSGVQNQNQVIKSRLDQAVKHSPTGRARAVTKSGAVVDLR